MALSWKCAVSTMTISVTYCGQIIDVAQADGARPSELEGRQFDPHHSIDVCFDFPLFRVAVALNTRKTEH